MPSHLEQFPIETDKELENWEMDHKAEYAAAKLPGLARLERCEVEEEGQKAALKNQRANVLMKLFPNVRYYRSLHTHSKFTRSRSVQQFSERRHQDHT